MGRKLAWKIAHAQKSVFNIYIFFKSIYMPLSGRFYFCQMSFAWLKNKKTLVLALWPVWQLVMWLNDQLGRAQKQVSFHRLTCWDAQFYKDFILFGPLCFAFCFTFYSLWYPSHFLPLFSLCPCLELGSESCVPSPVCHERSRRSETVAALMK